MKKVFNIIEREADLSVRTKEELDILIESSITGLETSKGKHRSMFVGGGLGLGIYKLIKWSKRNSVLKRAKLVGLSESIVKRIDNLYKELKEDDLTSKERRDTIKKLSQLIALINDKEKKLKEKEKKSED